MEPWGLGIGSISVTPSGPAFLPEQSFFRGERGIISQTAADNPA